MATGQASGGGAAPTPPPSGPSGATIAVYA
jgi:hypothetical protein